MDNIYKIIDGLKESAKECNMTSFKKQMGDFLDSKENIGLARGSLPDWHKRYKWSEDKNKKRTKIKGKFIEVLTILEKGCKGKE